MADPIKTIGQKLNRHSPPARDAIHIAVITVESDEKFLQRGNPIKLVYGSNNLVRSAAGPEYGEPGHGIVDPFLDDYLEKGDRFWMFMWPGSVENLHHRWTHPDVDSPGVIKGESEKWLRDFADRWHFDYDEMLTAAQLEVPEEGQDYMRNFVVARGIDLHDKSELGEDHEKFWYHLEILTGRSFGEEHRSKFGWSCTC